MLFLLFSLSFMILNLGGSYVSTMYEKDKEFDEWISWHVNNFKNKTILETKMGVVNKGEENRIDLKLRLAERSETKIVVSQDGSGNFTTINEAIQSIPLCNKRRVIVSIKPGFYREKIVIDKKKPFVTLMAEVPSRPPKISWNDTANSTSDTSHSATVTIKSDYFVAINIIFENTIRHEIGAIGAQAVALHISGTKGAFYNCTITGHQDTLYDHKGLHYFKHCSIYGDVDFICGYGQSLYEDCWLNSIATYDGGSITAQKRNTSSMSSGFSFKNCKVTGGGGKVYLGRSWGDHSRVVFSYTYMDNVVLPKGWDDWYNPNNDKTIYYGEYECNGPGANRSGRVPWARVLTYEEAQPFIGLSFVEGETWILGPYY